METFQDLTAEQWILGTESGGFTPVLTANAGIDTDGDGWLRLTEAGGNQSNFAYLNSPIPSANNTIDMQFEYTVHGGSGADGITFFMFDAATTFDTGAFGGSLGYANRTGVDGMAGGYFGLGLDTWGNYSNPTEGRNGGPGFLPDEVALRGNGSGQTGYAFIEGTGDGTNPSLGANLQFSARPVTGGATEDNYFGVKINISETSLLTVSMELVPGNGFNELFSAQLTGTRPDELMLGFSGSTGGATNFHEIRALSVTTTVQPVGAQFWDNDLGNDNWDDTSGGTSNWVSDGVPADWADIFFGTDYGTGAETVDTEQDRKVRSLNFDNPSDYTIEGGNEFEMDAPNGGAVTINVSEANYTGAADNSITHTIDEDIKLNDDLTITNITDSADLLFKQDFDTQDNDITANVTGKGLVTIDGKVSGTTSFLKKGDGTLVLADKNIDFTGGLTVDAGTVKVNESTKIVIGKDDRNNNFIGAGDVTVNNAGSLLTVTATGANDIEIDGGNNFTLNNGTVTLNAGDDMKFKDTTTTINGGVFNVTANDDILLDTNGKTVVNMTGGTANITTGSLAGNRFDVKTGTTWNQTGGTTNVSGFETRFFGTVTVDNAQMNINSTAGAEFDGTITVSNNGKIDVANDLNITGGSLTGGSNGTVVVGGDLIVDTSTTISSRPNITMDTDGTSAISVTTGTSLTGIGTLEINSPAGTGFTTINASVSNLEASKIDVSAGTLLLGASDQIANTTDLELSGGYFSTGGFDDTLDTLTLSGNSAIDLNGGNSILNFADSSGTTWTPGVGEVLTITNWDGIFNDGGGSDQINFGANGLDASQVSQIFFLNPKGEDGIVIQGFFSAQLLASGEIVPVMIPEPSTYFGGFLILGVAGLHFWNRRRKQ